MTCNLCGLFNDQHAAANASIELAHLKPYVAAADDSQARGKFRHLKPIFRADKINIIQALYRRDEAARACVNHRLLSRHFTFADARAEEFAVSPCETSMTFKQFRI